MILPITNIVAGFLLGASKIKEWFAKGDIEKAEGSLTKFRTPIGIIILFLGVLGLIKRMSFFGTMYSWSWNYGSSFPQAIIAILMGLLLCANYFAKWPTLHSKIMKMNEYSEWLGILGILIGVGSLI